MVKPTQNVGRPPEPFPGTWEQFTATVSGLIAYYHGRVVKGLWNAAPNAVFRAKVEAGWRPIFPEPLVLEMAFYRVEERKYSKQGIRWGKERYFHPELHCVGPIGTMVQCMVSGREDVAMSPMASTSLSSWTITPRIKRR